MTDTYLMRQHQQCARAVAKTKILLSVVAYLAFTSSAWADGPKIDWEKIFMGEVLVEATENSDGIPGVLASFCVSADRSRIWSVLTNYENFPQIFNGLNKILVLKSDEHGARVEVWYKVEFLKIFNRDLHYILDRRYIEPGRQLIWTRESGDMKRIEGGWEIRDTAKTGVYLLIYSSYVEPSWYIPAGLVRKGAMSEAADMARRVRAWMETQH